jgi:glycosyltransferase involved in cell wall biosynthesis
VTDKILLFIPAYNCEKQIARVLGKLDYNLLRNIHTLMVVNNRSTDSTEQVASGMINGFHKVRGVVMRNKANYGLGGSHKVAFDHAISNGFSHVIVFHGDDQGDINDLLPLVDQGLHRQYDCLLGARFHKDSTLVGYSSFRTLGNRVYNALFSLVLGKRILDLGSGLNLYDVDMLRDRFYEKFPDDLTFNYCMVMAASFHDHNTHFFPIIWREEDQISNVKMFSQARKVLRMLLSFVMGRRSFITSELRDRAVASYESKVMADNGVRP